MDAKAITAVAWRGGCYGPYVFLKGRSIGQTYDLAFIALVNYGVEYARGIGRSACWSARFYRRK